MAADYDRVGLHFNRKVLGPDPEHTWKPQSVQGPRPIHKVSITSLFRMSNCDGQICQYPGCIWIAAAQSMEGRFTSEWHQSIAWKQACDRLKFQVNRASHTKGMDQVEQ